jgi:hypothetical protein
MNTEYSKFGNPPIQIVESSSSGVKTKHRGANVHHSKKHLGRRHAEQDLPDRLEMGAAFFRGARLSRMVILPPAGHDLRGFEPGSSPRRGHPVLVISHRNIRVPKTAFFAAQRSSLRKLRLGAAQLFLP